MYTTNASQVNGSKFEAIVADSNTILVMKNEEEATKRLPVMLYLGLVSLIGTIGNIHVLPVFYFKFQKSNNRTFIISLAILDSMSCLFGMTFEIFDMRYPYMFYASTTCRIFRYNNSVISIGSGLTLVVIAFERYRKICKPLKKQLSHKSAKLISAVAILIAIVVSIPVAIMNGHRTVDLGQNVTGVDCTTNDEMQKSNVPIACGIILLLIFIWCFGALICLYSMIGKTLRYSTELRRTKLIEATGRLCSQRSSRDGTLNAKLTLASRSSMVSNIDIIGTNALDLGDRTATTGSNCSSMKGKIIGTQSSSDLPKLASKSLRVTKIFFVLTLVFLVCYIPYIVLAIIVSLKRGFVHDMSPIQFVVYCIAMRLYFINNALNPVIYGFCGGKFRKHCKELYTDLYGYLKTRTGKSKNAHQTR